MIKIIERKENKEIPTFPFITKFEDRYFMYVKVDEKIGCITLDTGELTITPYNSIEKTVERLDILEDIVEAEIVIK